LSTAKTLVSTGFFGFSLFFLVFGRFRAENSVGTAPLLFAVAHLCSSEGSTASTCYDWEHSGLVLR